MEKLMGLLKCIVYFAVTGVLAFILGRLLPKDWTMHDAFPFRVYAFEKNGSIYEKTGIKHWQTKVPDMSRIFTGIMPAKRLEGDLSKRLPTMIQETCMAELIHKLLCITGLYCLKFIPGVMGFAVWLVYVVVFNIPYIVIQRYNRPRLVRLYRRIKKQIGGIKGETVCGY